VKIMGISEIISLAVSITLCGLTILTFSKNGNKDTSKDGEWKGTLNEKLKNIKEDLEEIKEMVNQTTKDNKDSVRRLHERIDRHLREDHGYKITKADEEKENK